MATWTQSYFPLGNLYRSALVAALSVVVLLGALASSATRSALARPRTLTYRLLD